jgi:hypothetical protein
MAGPPKKIMIIRHGEKPPSNPKDAPFDVKEDGERGGGKSLIVIGWQRAGALNGFFAPHKTSPPKKDIAPPDFIYAADPSGESRRPHETIEPLAAWMGYTQAPELNMQYDIGGGEAGLVQSLLGLSGAVLICWEHDHIMELEPSIVKTLNGKVPIKNFSKIPGKWPDVFDLVWVFDLDKSGKEYEWNQVHQSLMAGDVKG